MAEPISAPPSGPLTEPGGKPLFDFTVPDELLQEAVTKSRDPEAVADLAMVPGTGEGKPPPLLGILRTNGFAPIVIMTAAAFVPASFFNGLSVLGPDIRSAFHLSLAALGALTFVGSVAQIAWGLPVAVAGDRGNRRTVTAVTLLIFAVVGPFMALAPNVWWFLFLLLIASVAFGNSDTVINSYLSDAYPTQARARIFAWRNLSDPLSQTIGVGAMTFIAATTHNWRWSLLIAALGIPVAVIMLRRLREPTKGASESHHILAASGMDVGAQQSAAPRVLLGAAVTRIMRIRSIYYQLVAVAILGFAGTGVPLLGSIYFHRVWHESTGGLGRIYVIIGLASFVGVPVAYFCGDRLFRRAPQRPLKLAAICIVLYGGLFALSLYMPELWMVVALQFLANVAVAPLSISIFQTLAATAPPEMRSITFAMFGVYGLVFGGFTGSVVLGALADSVGVTTALMLIGPVCAVGGLLLLIGSRFVRRDITLVIEDTLERFAEGKRRQAGGELPALQVHNLDFFYGTNQVLFDVNLEIAQGEVVALLGTNGAGKSTLLRVVSGLEHPFRGVVRIFGVNCSYLEPEQVLNQDVALLVGGKMTFPSLTVRDNLRIGGYSFRRDRSRSHRALDEAVGMFPELETRLDQAAGTLSGGEQQMLALARVMMTRPKLLMIDELALGLAPMTVDRLMAIVRRVNAGGTTVILVEQSVNRAMRLADHAIFLERGEVRFDGPTDDLLYRDDLLRPVFLGTAAAGLGGGGGRPAGVGASNGANGQRADGQRADGQHTDGQRADGNDPAGPSNGAGPA